MVCSSLSKATSPIAKQLLFQYPNYWLIYNLQQGLKHGKISMNETQWIIYLYFSLINKNSWVRYWSKNLIQRNDQLTLPLQASQIKIRKKNPISSCVPLSESSKTSLANTSQTVSDCALWFKVNFIIHLRVSVQTNIPQQNNSLPTDNVI